jgi:hypothetical protein
MKLRNRMRHAVSRPHHNHLLQLARYAQRPSVCRCHPSPGEFPNRIKMTLDSSSPMGKCVINAAEPFTGRTLRLINPWRLEEVACGDGRYACARSKIFLFSKQRQ